MNWYYALNGQQAGPVSEEELLKLFQSGVINAETLVWREGMANWQPLRDAGLPLPIPTTAAIPAPSQPIAQPIAAEAGAVVCSQCGQAFPPDQVIRYGQVPVCAGCKPVFLQKLREGTPVAATLEYAGFGARFAAKFLDGIILYLFNIILQVGARSIGGSDNIAVIGLTAIISIGLNIVYSVVFLGKFGATPGKMALKLKVVTPEGAPITYGRAFGRGLAEILSGIICYIGYIMAAFDDERRSLHDRIANTRVIKRG